MIAEYAEIYRRRTLIDRMARGQLRASVHRAVLGTAWYLVIPALQIAIYYLLVVVIFRAGAGSSYFLMLSMGIIHYGILMQSASNAAISIHSNAAMLLQIKIEPLVLVAVSYVRSLRTSLAGIPIFFLLYLTMSPEYSLKLLAYPFILLAWLWFCWNASVFLAAAGVFSRDLEKFLPFVIQLLMYTSPVIYSVTFFPTKVYYVFLLSPVTAIFALFQWCLVDDPLPPIYSIVLLPLSLTAMFFASQYFYLRGRKSFTKLM